MTPSDLLFALQFRYATKQFDSARRIAPEQWQVLEESLRLAPSSFGLQPWKFLVIETPETRSRLQASSWGQSQVVDASHFVVFVTRTDFNDTDLDKWMACLAEAQGKQPADLAGYRGMIAGFASGMTPERLQAWNAHQSYLAMGQFMLAAATLRIDTCPMEGLDPAAYDEILGLSGTGYRTLFACAAGYRSAEDKYAAMPKARYPLSEVIEHR